MLTMKFNIEYSTDFLDADCQFTRKNTLFFLQAGSIQVEGINETWGVWHISSLLKGEKIKFGTATSVGNELIPHDPIKSAQEAVHISIQRSQAVLREQRYWENPFLKTPTPKRKYMGVFI